MYSTPLDSTVRSTQSSRGTLLERTICDSERSALAVAVTEPLNQNHGSCPVTR